METNKDDVVLLEGAYHQQSFLRKKVSLTIPVCALLVLVFLSSAFIVTLTSLYWTEDAACYINNDEQLGANQPVSKPIYSSRPKRSLTSRKLDLPCMDTECCDGNLDPSAPWNQSRLPSNVYPIEYQLKLELFQLNEENNRYSGIVDIVIEVRSPTYDIILHGDLSYSNFAVFQRSSPNNTLIPINCVILFPNTQTLTIHLAQQLEVDHLYDVRISFSRALGIHGTGIFESQFNKDQFGLECVKEMQKKILSFRLC